MDIEPKYLDVIHPDATLLLRPKTNLNDMTIEVEPGSAPGHVEDGYNFPLSRTEPNVNLEALPLHARRRHAPVPAAAGRRRRPGDRRQGHASSPAPSAACSPSPTTPRSSIGSVAERRVAIAHVDPRLPPADDRTGAARRRGRTLRQLLQGGARQLRQPAAGAAGNAGRVPTDAERAQGHRGGRQSVLARRPPGPARPDPAGAGARRPRSPPPKGSSRRRRRRSATRSVPSPARCGLSSRTPPRGAPALKKSVTGFGNSLGAFNSFLNELAYKPAGKESFLFYVPWGLHDLNAGYNLDDAAGPLQRAQIMITCNGTGSCLPPGGRQALPEDHCSKRSGFRDEANCRRSPPTGRIRKKPS